jgi:hypothetical protein
LFVRKLVLFEALDYKPLEISNAIPFGECSYNEMQSTANMHATFTYSRALDCRIHDHR